MNRIDQRFRELRKEGKKAFIAFITAGYPDLKTTEKFIIAFDKIGVDIIELGIPFSDPMADGPIIQESSQAALDKGINLSQILNLVKRVRSRVSIPICFMSYYNPIFCFGEKKFVEIAQAKGVDGLIIPDLPPEEAATLIRYCRKADLDTVFFLSPTSDLKRIKLVAKFSKGFIYYISLTGVTGPRKNISRNLGRHIKEIKKYTDKSICVGFGISSASGVRKINAVADGVIVGSAIVKKIKENIGKADLVKKVANFVQSLNA
jgi:tryptophan synthase alpha chain